MDDLKALVYRALDVAVKENGYTELLTMTPEEVAVDILMYDSDVGTDDRSIHDIIPFILQWRSEQV
jgi:hypothetical protein